MSIINPPKWEGTRTERDECAKGDLPYTTKVPGAEGILQEGWEDFCSPNDKEHAGKGR